MVNIWKLWPGSPGPRTGSILFSHLGESRLSEVQFGAVTKFRLPPGRLPNGIVVASDGSVWFGEEALPGLGHLYANGTLAEYEWPFKYPAPYTTTSIFGVALWRGNVWSSDQAGNQLVELDPESGATTSIELPMNGSYPYTLTVGPDDSLWFTEVFGSKIGRVDAQLHLHEYPTPVVGTPGQIVFVNDSLGYYIDAGNVDLVSSGIFAFDPSDPRPDRIGGNGTLYSPTSLALGNGGIWVAQHSASNLAFYDLNSLNWRQYPTSIIPYQRTTLPYFVATNGSLVWFNEHYANRMALLDSENGLLTEYSLSNPPPNSLSGIDNALTFALGRDKVWFTELTAGYIGYVDASFRPNFSILPHAIAPLQLARGRETNVALSIEGKSNKTLTVQFSDSETITSKSRNIIMEANATEIASLNGQRVILLSVTTTTSIEPGDYTLLVTVTNGLINQGIYITLQVTT